MSTRGNTFTSEIENLTLGRVRDGKGIRSRTVCKEEGIALIQGRVGEQLDWKHGLLDD